eukprot:gene2699-3350_t
MQSPQIKIDKLDDNIIPGIKVENWKRREIPPNNYIHGLYADLEPLSLSRLDDLCEAFFADDGYDKHKLFLLLPFGSVDNRDQLQVVLQGMMDSEDDVPFSVIDKSTGKAVGILSLYSIVQDHGSIEVGKVVFSPKMQRSPLSSEAVYLLSELAMGMGYRRLEWKANVKNQRSQNAALRYGFSYEGIFRNWRIQAGYCRSFAWFSILDDEWPICKSAFKQWLDPSNFDKDGIQIQTLVKIRESLQRDEEFKQ